MQRKTGHSVSWAMLLLYAMIATILRVTRRRRSCETARITAKQPCLSHLLPTDHPVLVGLLCRANPWAIEPVCAGRPHRSGDHPRHCRAVFLFTLWLVGPYVLPTQILLRTLNI